MFRKLEISNVSFTQCSSQHLSLSPIEPSGSDTNTRPNATTLQQSLKGAQRISSVELNVSFFDDSRRRIEQMEEQYNGDHFVANS